MASKESGGERDYSSESVLILDDDEPVRQILELVVESAGAASYGASTVAEAMALATGRTFTCALIDKNLGQDSGLEFLQWLRERQPECDCIVITGYGNLGSVVIALRLGAVDYIEKPIDLDTIMNRLIRLFERRVLLRDRDLLRTQLIQADRLAALGTLAAGVVHEINNPLTYVLANIEFLKETIARLRADPSCLASSLADLDQFTATIAHGTDQMASVARHVRTFARRESATRSRTHLAPLLESTLQMTRLVVRQRAKVTCAFHDAPDVDAHENQLAQVFLNLIVNASQAIAEGAASQNEISVRLSTGADGSAVVEISDTGSGMSPQVMSRLFEPYFTTKPAGVGTGIGLTICRSIVEDHGGRIEVKSTAGKGSTFTVILPATSLERRAPRKEKSIKGGRRGRVLAIDDEEAVASALSRLLSVDHDVSVETSGRGALARFQAGETFDAVVCDLMMPEMTGAQFHGALAALSPSHAARVLFITSGVLSPPTGSFAQELGNRLMGKPFDADQLRARVRELVGP